MRKIIFFTIFLLFVVFLIYDFSKHFDNPEEPIRYEFEFTHPDDLVNHIKEFKKKYPEYDYVYRDTLDTSYVCHDDKRNIDTTINVFKVENEGDTLYNNGAYDVYSVNFYLPKNKSVVGGWIICDKDAILQTRNSLMVAIYDSVSIWRNQHNVEQSSRKIHKSNLSEKEKSMKAELESILKLIGDYKEDKNYGL